MRRLASLTAIFITGLTVAWCARGPEELTLQKINDRLFVIVGDGGNTAVFLRGDGVVLVDTKGESSGQRILDLVRTVTDRPITHILNTHTHNDHVGGNHFFASSVVIVAHENTAGQMQDMEEFRAAERKFGLPDVTFKDKLTLFAGNDAIDLYFFGAAHTNGDAFIVFRGDGVMHAGDTFPGLNVVERNGGSEEEYPKTMNKAATSITGVHTVIPGHSSVATWQEFVDDVARLTRR